ncbi:MAG: peptidoglycan DD-metalloendopeptidase family protein [Myxacorys chilensis ATA2-1-KO14]|nr:peptidoglycan DD-metalloendopeptidase family protein [Myxacorys chilensis ATA2-1-KO14]
MKRAVPQDANSVPLHGTDAEAVEEHPRQTLPEDNRRACTSAAMIGLAISVGAYGLLAPQKGDNASAAEPTSDAINAERNSAEPTGQASFKVVAEPTLANSTSSVQPTVTKSISIASSSQPRTVNHAVQDGQTLWKIAELYGIDVAKLAASNSLQVNAVLDVGQVLQVPSDAQVTIPQLAVKQMPELKQVPTIPAIPVALNSIPNNAASESTLQTLPKAKQPNALSSLKQNRDRLKQSLAELKSEESTNVAQAVPEVNSTTDTQLEAANLAPYQVQKGETLSAIAQSRGVSMAELAKLNQLSNPNLLKANQVIQVPQATLTAQPAGMSAPRQAAVAIPVVPSLAATQNVDSASVPLAVGGDAQQFAFGGANSKSSSADSVSYNAGQRGSSPYVNSLMSEIAKLRQSYQSRAAAQKLKPSAKISVPNISAAPRRENPEFKASRRLAALQTEARSVKRPSSKMEAMLADAPKPKQQLVATSALGSETYTPLIRTQVGKAVSPNLPPLGKSDSYLPNATDGRFKGYAWPAKGVLTSPYGWRWGRMHKGIDIAGPVGTPIVAAAPGKVVTAGWNDGGYGNLVEVEHSDGSVTLYAHNSRVLVRVGQQVTQGQQIALMGSTGYSTGPHSHFEVHVPGRGAVNPIAYLPQSRG